MPKPLVYVIVLNYNRRDDTLDCIRSLYAMDYPNFRVMLVDNASTDGTADAVRSAFPEAEIVVNEQNLMYAGGNNAGIKKALALGADYVMLINNDTVVDRGLLSGLMDGFGLSQGAGVAGPMIYYYPKRGENEELIWYAGGIAELWRWQIAHRDIRRVDTGQFSAVEDTGYVTGCCMLISRACLEETGLLDTSYGMYAEDVDFCIRAKNAGFRLVFVPGARMWHKVSMSMGGEFSARKLRLKLASKMRLFVKHASPWHWLSAPLFVLLRLPLRLVSVLLARRPGPFPQKNP